MKSGITRLGLALVALAALGGVIDARPSAAAAGRSYATGGFALELDGAPLGLVTSVSGGTAVAQVIVEPAAGGASKKRLGSTSYEDLEIELGLSLAGPTYDWIAASLQNAAPPRAVSITSLNANYEAVSQRAFQSALITEVTIPKCDASSKEAALLGVKLSSERVSVGKTSGKSPVGAGKQKQWLSSSFRLELDGVDASRVTQIDAFTIKRAGAQKAGRGAGKESGGVEFPNLEITLAEAGSESWQKWHDDFVINGKGTDQLEKSGRLVFLAPNLKDELLEIKLHNVGIFALRPSKREAGSAQVARLDAEVYVERMELVVKGAK